MPARFLDANVLLRYFIRDDKDSARNALAHFERIERGEGRVEMPLLVLLEVIVTLERTSNEPQPRIHALVTPVLEWRGQKVPGKPLVLAALDRFVTSRLPTFDSRLRLQ